MPEEIVKTYRHLYEKSDYIHLHNVLKPQTKPQSVLVKAFGVGEPDHFPDHFINVMVEKHTEEYLAVTNITYIGKEVLAKMSVDHKITTWEKRKKKMYLAYEWICVMLQFCKRKFGPTRFTLNHEVSIIISWLAEATKHCAKHLSSEFNQKMHQALRKLLVSESALQKVLLNISFQTESKIVSLKDLKEYMEEDYTRAYKEITRLLIQRFIEDHDIDKMLVVSRLQEVLLDLS